MTAPARAAAPGAVARSDENPTPLRPEVVEAYESMIAQVPDAGGDGYESILVALAAATDVRDLDAPWRTHDLEAFANIRLRITGIRKLPSDFAGGLPWFLVIDAVVKETGELVTISNGAVSVVAQLVRVFALGGFPVEVIPRIADRPTRSGFFPQHLEFVS